MENQPPEPLVLGVSDAIALFNQTLDYAYPSLIVEGEVASYKVNQGKYVFFDIKDDEGTLGCFMSLFQLRVQLEDGMRVRVMARPGLTKWGRFSLTVREIRPVGEGSMKRAFDLLRAKLDSEGLFAPERKRQLPVMPQRIGVISSTQAAGYGDFIKIISQRWGGVELVVAHVAIQGEGAPQQIVRAIEHFNTMGDPVDVLAIIRGGGSADDLSTFNDEPLVRAIAASRIPTVVGVGHEVDVSLADMVADVRAATPSNAAQLLVPDRSEIRLHLQHAQSTMARELSLVHDECQRQVSQLLEQLARMTIERYDRADLRYHALHTVLQQLDPRSALSRGYALVFSPTGVPVGARLIKQGERLRIETKRYNLEVGVENVTEKHT